MDGGNKKENGKREETAQLTQPRLSTICHTALPLRRRSCRCEVLPVSVKEERIQAGERARKKGDEEEEDVSLAAYRRRAIPGRKAVPLRSSAGPSARTKRSHGTTPSRSFSTQTRCFRTAA